MKILTFLADTFTSVPFEGNPTAVCVNEGQINSEIMLSIARELNLPVTAFIQMRQTNVYDIRYFTITTEIPACGHATLASAKIIFDQNDKTHTVEFHTVNNNVVTAFTTGENILMRYPVYHMESIEVPGELLSSLCVEDYLGAGYCKQLETLFIEVDPASLRTIQPDYLKLQSSSKTIKEVVLTSVSDDHQFDYLLRSFCPWIGIDEDPVTGSVHSVLGNFWKQKLKKANMKSFQASPRGGEIIVRVFHDRVEIGGKSVILLRGEMTL